MTETNAPVAAAARTLLVGATTAAPEPVLSGPVVHLTEPGIARDLASRIHTPAALFVDGAVVDEVTDLFPEALVVVTEGEITAMDDLYLEPQGDAGEGIAVRVQDYASSPYVSILGTTLVRVDGSDDVAAFLDDADRAFADGVFAEFLTHPAVEIADSGEIDGATTRLRLHDGGASVSPFGLPRPLDEVIGASPTVPAIAATIGDEEWTRRPWLPRYLRAVQTLRRIAANGHPDARVSGFGIRVDDHATGSADLLDAGRPVVAVTRDSAFVAQGDVLVRCSPEAGQIADTLARADEPLDDLAPPDSPARRLLTALASQGISFSTPAVAVPA